VLPAAGQFHPLWCLGGQALVQPHENGGPTSDPNRATLHEFEQQKLFERFFSRNSSEDAGRSKPWPGRSVPRRLSASKSAGFASAAAEQETLGDPAKILDQHDPERAWLRPKFADGQRRTRLVCRNKAAGDVRFENGYLVWATNAQATPEHAWGYPCKCPEANLAIFIKIQRASRHEIYAKLLLRQNVKVIRPAIPRAGGDRMLFLEWPFAWAR